MPKRKLSPTEMATEPLTARQLVLARWLTEQTGYHVDPRSAALAYDLQREFRADADTVALMEAAAIAEAKRAAREAEIAKLRARLAELEADDEPEMPTVEVDIDPDTDEPMRTPEAEAPEAEIVEDEPEADEDDFEDFELVDDEDDEF